MSVPEPKKELGALILAKIEFLQKKQLGRKLVAIRLSLAGSVGAFIWAVLAYGKTFLQSDFWVLLQLLLTDASAVLKNWNDFLFSLLETFPVVSATIMLVPILFILISFSTYFKLTYLNHRNRYNYI